MLQNGGLSCLSSRLKMKVHPLPQANEKTDTFANAYEECGPRSVGSAAFSTVKPKLRKFLGKLLVPLLLHQKVEGFRF